MLSPPESWRHPGQISEMLIFPMKYQHFVVPDRRRSQESQYFLRLFAICCKCRNRVRQKSTNVLTKYEALGSTGLFLAFVRGVIANWLVCLGVTMALVSKSVPGKILACWLPITAFQTMGMEHIVVNMFLHSAGPLLGSGVPFLQVILWNFLPVTLGNILGGMVTNELQGNLDRFKGVVESRYNKS